MIAQDIGFPVLFSKERCSYSYSRLRKKCWGINRQARARELYEISGLRRAVRLVWFPDTSQRQIDLNYAQIGEQVAFADGFPLLLTNQASLDDLNQRLVQRLAEPIEMIRFRPNIVINTGCAFEEDQHADVVIGEHCFKVAKPCARCIIPSINPLTTQRQAEVSNALSYRKKGRDVLFGQNLLYSNALYQCLQNQTIELNFGDPVSWKA